MRKEARLGEVALRFNRADLERPRNSDNSFEFPHVSGHDGLPVGQVL